MDAVVSRSGFGVSLRNWLQGARQTPWTDALTFLIFLIFLGRVQGAGAVGSLALGWALAIPW
ncbi:MAG: hypothetical protein R3257_07775, partial [bacterium]|nr:hypothetical protein [bacterium]